MNRKSKVQPSQQDRSKESPLRAPGDCYSVFSYHRAITRACKKPDAAARDRAIKEALEADPAADVSEIQARVFVPKWSPHRLRHNAVTSLQREFGIELARIVLGHLTAFTTEIYAEADQAEAVEAIAKVG